MTETNRQNLMATAPPPKKPAMQAAFNRYDSPFLQLLAPMVATRYFWLAIRDLNPLNFLNLKDPSTEPGFVRRKDQYFSGNIAALGMGTTLFGIVGMYSLGTLKDIKSLYAEAVGYELGKKPEEVTTRDIFFGSKNKAIQTTCQAYRNRTAARLFTALTFFIPWHMMRGHPNSNPKYDVNINAGVGAVGIQLFWEGFFRRPSFFDAQQKLVSSRISNLNPLMHGVIEAGDIETLIWLQRKHLNKSYLWPDATSLDGQQDRQVSARIADLMNQTYHDVPMREPANLTLGKLNYLIGFGLLEKHPESLAFVELANRSADMSEVKQAMAAIQSGRNPQEVFGRFSIGEGLPSQASAQPAMPKESGVAPAEQTVKRFTDRTMPRGHQEFALNSSGSMREYDSHSIR